MYSHFAERIQHQAPRDPRVLRRAQQLSEQELLRCGAFQIPGVPKRVVQKGERRMGRNPATGEPVEIPATVVKARIAKQLKDVVET